MSKIIFFIAILIMLQGLRGFSQLPIPGVDFGSNLGSQAITVEYGTAAFLVEPKLRKKIPGFTKEYAKRLMYFLGSIDLANRIMGRINDVGIRYNEIAPDYGEMMSFRYSKTKKNHKRMELVITMLDDVYAELDKQKRVNVLHGDKLNLYLNTMESLSKIYRLLDIIEEDINQARLINRFMKFF